eukprot:TRINITY_DN13332_c0_g1_i1.p1 TRINITY_DN13332_c0_g1~~TRINITY_DN13332_c0_g1_i1.p1  ORF type:complete len:114 (-),score=9.35 TRINITY_DN13332_c0_g1_i1:34-375(-)
MPSQYNPLLLLGDLVIDFGKPSNTFSGSSGPFKTGPEQSVQSFPSSGEFSNRFGEPSSEFSGSAGQFNSESNNPANSFFSRRPIEPQQSHVSKPKELFDFKIALLLRHLVIWR